MQMTALDIIHFQFFSFQRGIMEYFVVTIFYGSSNIPPLFFSMYAFTAEQCL